MTQYKLIYFKGCPNHPPIEQLLNALNLPFEAICQDDLDESSPLKAYSSPTLLADSEIIFGARAEGGGCSMSLPSQEELIERLKKVKGKSRHQ